LAGQPAIEVSVVMAVYNAASYLRASVDSILGQTRDDFEFIMVDDGSTDESRTIIGEYGDPRIKLLDLAHAGIVPALNHAIGTARGRYVARMDADDVSLPRRLALQVAALEADPTTVVAGCGFVEIDAFGRQRSVVVPPTLDVDLRRRLMVRNPYAGGSVMMRRDALLSIGGYPQGFELAEDYEVLHRLSAVGTLTSAPEILYQWRVHPPSTSQRFHVEMRASHERVNNALWRSHPPTHRSHRAINDCVTYYQSLEAGTNGVLVAQLLETECLLALATLKRGGKAAGLRQLASLSLVQPRAWWTLAQDLPERLQRRARHSALAQRYRGGRGRH
jgi:glycosyltransferase involved in cell wall biosynthesis